MKKDAQICFFTPYKNAQGEITGEVVNNKMIADFQPLYEMDESGNEILLCYEGTFCWNQDHPIFMMDVEAYLYATPNKEIFVFHSSLKSIPSEAVALFSAMGFTISNKISVNGNT